jgi:hypothetical protein
VKVSESDPVVALEGGNCSSRLLPKKVGAIQTNLLSIGNEDDYVQQLFCIVLISIYRFLQHEKCHQMKADRKEQNVIL